MRSAAAAAATATHILLSTGNDGQPFNNKCPAACPSAVTVTAIDQQNGAVDANQAPAHFSNYLWLADVAENAWPVTSDKINRTVAAPGENEVSPRTLGWMFLLTCGYFA
jgi:hypothetical protein